MKKKKWHPEKPKTAGYLWNCIIQKRDTDKEMFYIHKNCVVLARLDGYAIIPIEEYEKLGGKI